MYSFNLNIAIISQDLYLYDLFSNLSAPEDITPHISVCGDTWQDEVQGAQIIFLDLPHSVLPEQVRAHCKSDVLVVVCADSEGMAGLKQASLQATDLFWIKPLIENIAAMQFTRIAEDVRSHKIMSMNKMFLDTLMESMPDMVWFKNLAGVHVKVNDSFCRVAGKTKQDVTNRDHCYIWDVSKEEFEHGEFVCKETDQFVIEHRTKCFSTEKVKSQHGMRQFNTYKAPLLCEDGELWGTVGIGHDITDLENMGAELEIILRSMPFAILVWDDEGIIIDANNKFEEYFNTSRDKVIGKCFDSWKKGALLEYESADNEGYPEIRVSNGDLTQEKTLEIHEEPILDVFHNVVGRLCIYRDITKERELEHKILQSSNTDFLTGLYNRRFFYQFIRENYSTQPISLMYVDLDRFKKVNDTFGHQAGDEALIITARLLNECFVGNFIARIGGDEFLVAIPGCHAPDTLAQAARHLLNRMHQVFSSSSSFKILSASIGIAQSEGPTDDIDLLIQKSDLALYQAKTSGRSQYCFYEPQS